MRAWAVVLGFSLAGCATVCPNPQEADTGYVQRQMLGWTLHVNAVWLRDHPEESHRTFLLLEQQLFQITRAAGRKILEDFRLVPIWIEPKDIHGRHPCMVYHPSREWLTEHGYDPRKAGAVEIANAGNFLSWCHQQPWMVLHEMAHAYHHRVLGADHSGIRQAWEHGVASGRYDSVLHWNARSERAYAITNEEEYFAELSETYFGTNDFFPFVRAELAGHDPDGLRLMEQIWGQVGPPAQAPNP